MLLTDATLVGESGGSSSSGGVLSVHSGRFYQRSEAGVLQGVVSNADINLVVRQSGDFVPASGKVGIGHSVVTEDGTTLQGKGYFATDRLAKAASIRSNSAQSSSRARFQVHRFQEAEISSSAARCRSRRTAICGSRQAGCSRQLGRHIAGAIHRDRTAFHPSFESRGAYVYLPRKREWRGEFHAPRPSACAWRGIALR
jgi:hypothetical protein